MFRNRHATLGRPLLVVIVLSLLTLSVVRIPPSAADVNRTQQGLAVDGYDVVAYFTLGRAVRGTRRFHVTYQDARYTFISAVHKAMFETNPEKYLPSYGGFCAYGIRLGSKSNIDPEVWDIVNGRLYLQFSRGTQLVWKQNTAHNITIADRIWPQIKNIPADRLPLKP